MSNNLENAFLSGQNAKQEFDKRQKEKEQKREDAERERQKKYNAMLEPLIPLKILLQQLNGFEIDPIRITVNTKLKVKAETWLDKFLGGDVVTSAMDVNIDLTPKLLTYFEFDNNQDLVCNIKSHIEYDVIHDKHFHNNNNSFGGSSYTKEIEETINHTAEVLEVHSDKTNEKFKVLLKGEVKYGHVHSTSIYSDSYSGKDIEKVVQKILQCIGEIAKSREIEIRPIIRKVQASLTSSKGDEVYKSNFKC